MSLNPSSAAWLAAPFPCHPLLLSLSMASSSGTRLPAGASCGSTPRILTPFHFSTNFATLPVSVSIPDTSDWPRVVPNPAPGVKLGLLVNTPHLPFVQLELRTLQGAL